MLFTYHKEIQPSAQGEYFLPPVSRWTSLAGMFLVGTLGAGIGLSSWVKYNVTVKTTAAVRPTGEIRLVQAKVEGTVKNILVKENQQVKRGDAIAYLEDEPILIKRSQLLDNIQQTKLQVFQIDAQIRALDSQIIAEATVAERVIASSQADLVRNQREYQERKVTTSSELLAAQASLEKSVAGLQKAQADLSFAEVDRDRYEKLSKEGAVGEREYEQKKLVVVQTQAIVEAEKKAIDIAKAKLQAAQATINPTNATVEIAQETARGEANIATLKKEKQALIQRRVEIQNQIKQYQKELQQVIHQLQDTVLRASSDGIILKLNLRNPGQVLRPSEPIAEIAPNNAPLVIKANVPTQEIKNVAVGQKVHLRIDACPYPDYGTLKAVVTSVSPDAITPGNNSADTAVFKNSATYFEATIQPERMIFGQGDRQCNIQSGMTASADIISKEETALQFILRKARLITDL
jgi:HlyD family secretion protein